MTCKECVFSDEIKDPNQIGKAILQCRRFPPTAFPVPQPGGVAIMTIRPVVQPGVWCGEFDDGADDDNAVGGIVIQAS